MHRLACLVLSLPISKSYTGGRLGLSRQIPTIAPFITDHLYCGFDLIIFKYTVCPSYIQQINIHVYYFVHFEGDIRCKTNTEV